MRVYGCVDTYDGVGAALEPQQCQHHARLVLGGGRHGGAVLWVGCVFDQKSGLLH